MSDLAMTSGDFPRQFRDLPVNQPNRDDPHQAPVPGELIVIQFTIDLRLGKFEITTFHAILHPHSKGGAGGASDIP